PAYHFSFNDTAPTQIYTLSLHDALPISTVRKLVGLHKYANITLKRGYMRDQSLWNWRKGQSDRRKITISVMNQALKRLQRWHLRSEEHTSELQSLTNLVCRLLLEKKKLD